PSVLAVSLVPSISVPARITVRCVAPPDCARAGTLSTSTENTTSRNRRVGIRFLQMVRQWAPVDCRKRCLHARLLYPGGSLIHQDQRPQVMGCKVRVQPSVEKQGAEDCSFRGRVHG